MKKAYQETKKIICPVLILHGTEDRIVPINSSIKFFKTLPIKDKTFIDFKDAYHEVFEDPSWGESFHDTIVNWICTH